MKGTFFRAEIFRAFYSQVYLSVDKISARNNVIQFVGIYRTIGKNSTKIAITLEGRPKSTYPFGGFHTSLESILYTESELENILSLGYVPSPVSKEIQLFLKIFCCIAF